MYRICMLLFTTMTALLLTGCTATVESRIAQRQEVFDAFPESVQDRIRRGQIRLGDSKDAVWMVYGEPRHKSRRLDKTGISEAWTYQILGYNSDNVGPRGIRTVYIDTRNGRRATYFIDNTPEYEWKEVLRVEFCDGHVTSVQMTE